MGRSDTIKAYINAQLVANRGTAVQLLTVDLHGRL
jgi:hypothetical protein